jgi:hypothetical protein
VLLTAENCSGKPILYFQTTNSFERVYVGGHDRGASCASVRGDQQIVAANRLSRRFQSRADSAVFGVKWRRFNGAQRDRRVCCGVISVDFGMSASCPVLR